MLNDTCSSLVYTGELFVFIASLPAVATPQDKIIEQLESYIERLKLEIFELKGDNKLLRMQLKEASTKLQEIQGYYDADGNFVE